MRISRLPLAGVSPDFEFYQLVVLGVMLLLLLLGLSLLFLRRGALAVAFGWVPATLLSPIRLMSRQNSQREAERKRLLRALISLDDRRAAGSITEGSYVRQRDRIHAELRPLMAADLQTAPNALAAGAALVASGREDGEEGATAESDAQASPAMRGGPAS